MASRTGLRAALSMTFALASLLYVRDAPAETPAVCRAYAQKAVDAFGQNQARGCRYSNARWQGDFNAHYNWCLAAPSVSVSHEAEFRENELRVCLGEHKAVQCRDYAILSSGQQASNLSGGCGFTGVRWQDNFDQHMKWCMGAPDWTVVNSEMNIRFAMLGVCSKQEPFVRCDAYARKATQQGEEARLRNCGFTGVRWTATYEQHLSWCIGEEASVADAETRNREGPLSQCRTTSPIGASPPGPEACLWTTVVRNDRCVNLDGTESTILAPGSRSASGCGGTAQVSVDRAKLNLDATNVCLTEGNTPEPGCCTYTKQTFQGCECR
jgi:hypothetical protein